MNSAKHVLTGLFVLAGLVLLGTLIVWFEGVPRYIRGGYAIRAHLPNSMGITSGKRVHRDGIEIGEVADVASSLPQRPGVWIIMRINAGQSVPASAVFTVHASAMGDARLDFRTDAAPGAGTLPTDGSAVIEGRVEPYSFLPSDLQDRLAQALESVGDLKDVLRNLKDLTEPRTLADVRAGKPRNLPTTLEQFSDTAASLQHLAEGPATRDLLANANQGLEDLQATLARSRQSLAQLDETLKAWQQVGYDTRDTMAVVRKTGRNADQMVEKVAKDAEKIGQLVEQLSTAVKDLREGKGTLGKLMADPELHDALLALVENLNQVSKETERLLVRWRKEGILSKEK